MTPLISTALISHVILGLVAVMGFYAAWLGLLKKEPPLSFLKTVSLTALLSIVLSWISGGYYYVVYYGEAVKPVIVAGAYPWAHALVTETKEHVFLVMPFAALALAALIWIHNGRLLENPRVKSGAVLLSAMLTVLGTFITLAGVIMSGGAQ